MEVVLVGADWCPYTQKAKKVLSEASGEMGFKLNYIEVSSEEGRNLAKKHNIISVPVILQRDEVVYSKGVPSKSDIKKILERSG
jgi:glutaredoxin